MIPRYAPTFSYPNLFHCLKSDRGEKLEKELATRLSNLSQVKHVFLTESARVGLYTILKAYNRAGRVLMPAYNCIVVPEAVHYAGYQPGFVDIDPCTLNVSPEVLERAITPDTTAVLATHLFGIPCNLENTLRIFKERDILIIEDAAPALGAEYHGQPVGSFGDAAIISFQSTKVISGEAGGALITNNDELADKVRDYLRGAKTAKNPWPLFIKALGRKIVTSREVYSVAQFSYRTLLGEQMYEVVPPQNEMPSDFFTRCPSFASALVLEQMDRLEWNLNRRRKIAKIYRDELSGRAGLMLPEIPEGCSPAWIQFPILTKHKWELYKYMQRNRVDVTWTYRYSCADSYGLDNFPEAQRAAKTVLGLPTYPSLTDMDAQHICDLAKSYLAKMQ